MGDMLCRLQVYNIMLHGNVYTPQLIYIYIGLYATANEQSKVYIAIECLGYMHEGPGQVHNYLLQNLFCYVCMLHSSI